MDRPSFFCLAILCSVVPAARAQQALDSELPPQVRIGGTEVRTLTSYVVEGQEYHLYVNLPRTYWNTEKRSTYPVLYLLDGQWDFPLVSAIFGGQYYDGFVPEIIIVGVTWGGDRPNYDSLRVRDFTPTQVEQLPHAGGSEAFLSFIKDELIPFIEAEYPARPDNRALMGSSLGGLFALYAMFHQTALFSRYVVSSPALRWDNGVGFRMEQLFADAKSDLPARVFMVTGELEDVAGFDEFAARLRRHNYGGLVLESRVLDGMGHSGSKPEGFARGLQSIYRRPSLSLEPDLLDEYVGTYRTPGRTTVEIRRDEDHLVARLDGQDLHLHAESEDAFYLLGSYLFIRFNRKGRGVVGFDVEMFNNAATFERVDR